MSLFQEQPTTPERSLSEYDRQREWRLPSDVAGPQPVAAFDGRGTYPLVIALATSLREPTAAAVREQRV
jgi:hypothetical protein